MQMGFVSEKGTIDVIFIMRQMIEKKYEVAGKKLYMVFVDLGKAFDSVPREVIWWALKKKRSSRKRNKGDCGNIYKY